MFYETKRQLRELAYTDELTGLPNRARFLLELEGQVQDHPGDFGLAFIDLDGLKDANDELGHSAGDVLLQNAGVTLVEHTPEKTTEEMKLLSKAASVVRDTIRKFPSQDRRIDYMGSGVFRLGGDEFVVILSGANTQAKVNGAVGRLTNGLFKEDIRASIGGRPHQAGETGMDLLASVDQKMYAQKEARKQARRRQEIRALPLHKRLAYMGSRVLANIAGLDPLSR